MMSYDEFGKIRCDMRRSAGLKTKDGDGDGNRIEQ